MKENKYDDPSFFKQYGQMTRSQQGLKGAGEWYILKEMLPNFHGKDVLDMGCGFGWHCRYAIEKGAASVVGIDISEKMLVRASEINLLKGIKYERMALEDAVFPGESFDMIFSSLTLHYIKSYHMLIHNVYQWLRPGGHFVFSVEHPVFTAEGKQSWICDEERNKLYWPVDNYFIEGKRNTIFLGEQVVKYHRTLTTYLHELLKCGFIIKQVQEPVPDSKMLNEMPEMKDELRRPMMMLISVEK
ncbi:class I SAM-dependent methyltransferase [Pseudopedobacter sp.]|uniref:class I SAM-dependent methyltransferase n=1 Tax=Pseudopedobacter sp. TaxID=1936787 RepID=UPI00333F7FD5